MVGASAGAFVMRIRYSHSRHEVQKALDSRPDDSGSTASESKDYLGMKALIVGHDPEMISIFSHLFREKGVEARKCFLESDAFDQLSSTRFQAIVLDCNEVDCAKMVKNLPLPNERVLVIAIASDGKQHSTSHAGVSFVVERPLTPQQVREVLRVAYGRMLRDGQQYFRLTVELPVSIRKTSGVLLQCTTLNLSQTGMAVRSESSFVAGEPVRLVFAIPNTDISVSAEGKVIWDDRHGKTGISFQCDSPSVQSRYYEWLHDHFFMLRSDVAQPSISERQQEEYADRPFIRQIFKIPHLAALRYHRDSLRRTGPVRNADESRSLLGSSTQRRDRRAYRSSPDNTQSFN